jgi:DNA-3-methyladenine glycosylase I
LSSKPKVRCQWVDLSKPDYVQYHDEEWGVPVYDDQQMFEFLTLESAQAGLSWYTVLKKRANYRRAFADFEVAKVSRFKPAKIEKLLLDEGLIRNRLKMTAAVNNARLFLDVQREHGSFCDYMWAFVQHNPIVNAPRGPQDFVATSPESDALSKDLKKRGFKFVGSTIVYALLQAAGLVNDHSRDCFRRREITDAYESC